jgi:hypothetical protein
MKRSQAKNNGIAGSTARCVSQLAVPDGKIGWFPSAVERGLSIVRDYPVSLCFSVSPRPTSHLVARRLAKTSSIPWVADFALPWSDASWLSGRPRFVEWIDKQLEVSTLRSAQHITVAYPDIARGICERLGRRRQTTVSVVPTGFAEDLFGREIRPLFSRFTIVYPGNHFCEGGRHGQCFLKAVDEWVSLNPELKGEIDIVFIGERHGELERQRAAMKHPEVIRVTPFISHRACIEAIRSSHLCLVNTVGNRIPDKVYECMRAQKWILALSDPGSDLENLMRSYPGGIPVAAVDISAIRNALHKVWEGSNGELDQSEPAVADSFVERYSSRRSAEMLSGILDELVISPAEHEMADRNRTR